MRTPRGKRISRFLPAVVAAGALAACSKGTAGLRPEPASLPGVSESSAAAKSLYAVFKTSRGEMEFRLLPQEAPKTVANFTELASGRKEWTDPATGAGVRRPLYDGTVFFRVIPGFLIQGGDPLGTGAGGPGYRLEQEHGSGRRFVKPGLLAMADSADSSHGSQFFITVDSAPWLNGRNTIFGELVGGIETARAVSAAARVVREGGRFVDRPIVPEILESVRIEER
ncbi:MAG: peptidylprolyl isomerase [Elusimicrobiota bacterium]